MPTPLFAFRLNPATQEKIKELAQIYYTEGDKSASRFAREILETIMSGDLQRIGAFLTTFSVRMTGQLELDMQAASTPKGAAKPPVRAKPKRRARVRTPRA